MPFAAPRVCGLCASVHPRGERCPKAMERDRERKARNDAKRPNARQRGYDGEWQVLRAKFLAAYPSCRRCGGKATTVDHIVPIRVAPHRRLDVTNLQALCASHHSGAKQSADRSQHP